jgi:hypothetical protein
MSATVSINRAEFDEIVVELGAIWELVTRLYSPDDLDAFVPSKLAKAQARLLRASGAAVDADGEWVDETAVNERMDREHARRNELLGEYAEILRREAVAS